MLPLVVNKTYATLEVLDGGCFDQRDKTTGETGINGEVDWGVVRSAVAKKASSSSFQYSNSLSTIVGEVWEKVWEKGLFRGELADV